MGKSNVEQLNIAKKYLGNGGSKFRKYCGLPSGSAWCDAFVTTIFAEAGNSSLFCNGTKQTYCPTTIKWCRQHLAEVPPYLALPSDIIFFDWEPNSVPNHIGFVRERKDCEAIYTIEGNTSGGIVANKVRNTKYVCGIYRPHFKASYKIGTLEVDGLMGYNSIAMLQHVLGCGVDGILGKGTVRALQKRAGTTQDGHWGNGTSRAVQRMLGVEADGLFGPDSVKALQKWCNKEVFPQQVKSWQDKAVAYARKTAKSGKYKYKRWTSNANTHKCPICHPGSGNGYNCIGWAFSIWRHGGGLKNHCNNGVIANEVWERILKAPTQAQADKIATEHVGVPVTVIRNGGKAIPTGMLKAGDICALFKGSKYYHTIFYQGNGKYSESNSGSKPQVRADVKLSGAAKNNLKVAIRYVGR